MFIELTAIDGDIELVNVNHIKRIYKSKTLDGGTSVEWTHAPLWNNNPSDYISLYKESLQEVGNRMLITCHEQEVCDE